MNSIILLAKLECPPELRHTTDGKEVSEAVVSFEEKDTVHTLKAIAWGNTATSFHQELKQNDTVILDGSIQMNTVERTEGFKEKRAEMVVSRFSKISSGSPTPPAQVVQKKFEEPDPDDVPF